MIAAVVWKEYREQRIAWAALALVGAATLFALPELLAPRGLESEPQARDWVASCVVLVAWAYGVICGAMLLAGEREAGTLPFLDALPGLRGQVWRAKCLAGVALVVAQVAVLAGLTAAAQLFPTWQGLAATLLSMAAAALFGLAWGMLFSSFGRSVMNMILAGLAGQLAACFVFLLPAAFLAALVAQFYGASPEASMSWSYAAVAALSIPAALGASALVFTRPDRGRLRPSRTPARAGRAPRLWGRLFWLTWRQSRYFTWGLLAFSVLLGFLTLADGLVVWPATTLLVGVLCGATAFADEQQGPFRFLGDQRFPLGRYWVVKVGFRALVAGAASLLVLLPSFVRALTAPHDHVAATIGGGLFIHVLRTGLVLFLTLWLVCGFCSGCLFGLLLRNGLASGVFALGFAVLLAAAWVPSLLDGGLNYWQPLGPPLLLLASTPLLLRPWAAGRILSWTTVSRLAPFAVLAVLWTAFGLWYRVLEIPDVAPKYDIAAFRANLPKADDNPAGDRVRAACARFAELRATIDAKQPGPAAAPGLPGPAAAAGPAPKARQETPTRHVRLIAALQHGWPAGDAELDDYLSRLGDDEWRSKLAQAADLPTGMAEDPRLLTVADLNRTPEPPGAPMALVLAASGLRRQAHGDDAAFVEDLRVGLSLSRNLRHYAPRRNAVIAMAVEGVLLIGADRWLERLDGRPDLLKQALAILSDHLKETEAEDGDRVLVDYVIARNTLEYPLDWLTEDLDDENRPGLDDAGNRDEALLAVQARLVPWERARQERLLRLLFEGGDDQRRILYESWRPGEMLGSLRLLGPGFYADDRKGFERCRAPAMRLKLALRWYEAENGRPADNLDDLVPKYLPKIPADPFQKNGQPFHYRLSKGEKIAWPPDVPGGPPPPLPPGAPPPPPPSVDVPPGQGILWSVGSDGRDDGGVRQANVEGYTAPGEDVIFLVPTPPEGK